MVFVFPVAHLAPAVGECGLCAPTPGGAGGRCRASGQPRLSWCELGIRPPSDPTAQFPTVLPQHKNEKNTLKFHSHWHQKHFWAVRSPGVGPELATPVVSQKKEPSLSFNFSEQLLIPTHFSEV